ncbi:Mu transposase C-terminal domain-containing protein [Pseudomonas sp.]|uniref:Mu transposase C-terminal domain-containing protein n=1 Tax=Pseudomonas sp. TaxID=306 RepID=UPI003D14E63F
MAVSTRKIMRGGTVHVGGKRYRDARLLPFVGQVVEVLTNGKEIVDFRPTKWTALARKS